MSPSGPSGLRLLVVTLVLGALSSMTGAFMTGTMRGQTPSETLAPVSAESAQKRCILYTSTCQSGKFDCASVPYTTEILCSDPRCIMPNCLSTTAGSTPEMFIHRDAPETDDEEREEEDVNEGGGGASGTDDCMVRQFTCNTQAGPTCFKRIRTSQVKCTDAICRTHECIRKDLFMGSYALAMWDTGTLPGPFPRAETMCTIQTSSCPPEDTSCFSDVSVSQVSCSDARCTNGQCMSRQISVDDKDNILLSIASSSRSSAASSRSSQGQSMIEMLLNPQQPVTYPAETTVAEPVHNAAETPVSTGEMPGTQTTPLTTIRANQGCYTVAGIWTTDRMQCDTDQGRHLNPATTPGMPGTSVPAKPDATDFNDPRESILRYQIEQRFFPADERAAKIMELRSSAEQAAARLNSLLSQQVLDATARTTVSDTIGWLTRITTPEEMAMLLSVNDIHGRAEEMAVRLQQTQSVVQASLAAAGIPLQRNPVTLVEKADRIMQAMAEGLNIMGEEQVSVSMETLNGYFMAETLYSGIRTACLSDTSACLRISDVVTQLEPVVAGMKEAIQNAGRPDIEERINQLFVR